MRKMGNDFESINQESDMLKHPKGRFLITKLYGSPWICGNLKRIYISGHQVAALCQVTYYMPFNRSSSRTTVDSVEVESKARADAIADGFDAMKFYYDFKSDTVFLKDIKALPYDIRQRVMIVKNSLNQYLKDNFRGGDNEEKEC